MGRRRAPPCRTSGHVLRRAGRQWTGPCAFERDATGAAWNAAFEVLASARHGRPGRRRAVRLHRRHQPAGDRLGSRRATDRRAGRSTTAISSRSASFCSAIATSTASTPIVRCSMPSARDRRACLPAEDAPEKKDLGRNGTYLVMRQLRQDVRGFWQFVDRAGRRRSRRQPTRLAAAFVGRTRAGDPLVPRQTAPIAGIGTQAGRGSPESVHLR